MNSPLVSHSQPARIPRIGVLGNENNQPWEGLRHGSRDLGYIDRRNITIEWRWSEANLDKLPLLAREFGLTRKWKSSLHQESQGTRAAKQATATIPIVMTSW